MLARAFRDNPLNRAVIGPDPARRLRCNRHGMGSLLPVAQAGGHVLTARSGGAPAAALVSAPPLGYPLPAAPLPARLRCVAGQGWRVARRWTRVFEALRERHPSGPHWTLGTLGVAPGLQGAGIGSALLAHWLAEVDRDGCPAYLETDLERNLPLYERAGFAVCGELELLGVRIWRMARPPRP